MRPGRAADHSPPSNAVVMGQSSYSSTHPPGHTGPVTGSLYLFSIQRGGNRQQYVPVTATDFGISVYFTGYL